MSNGKYMEETKYSNMHTVSSLDDSKYTNCHDHTMKQHSHQTQQQQQQQQPSQQQQSQQSSQPQYTTTNLTVGGCHSDTVNDNNMTVIKSEDGSVTHSYVLPPFLH